MMDVIRKACAPVTLMIFIVCQSPLRATGTRENDYSFGWRAGVSGSDYVTIESDSFTIDDRGLVNLPYLLHLKQGEKWGVFSREIPPLFCTQCVLLIKDVVDVSMVFIDGEKVYDFGTENYPARLEHTGRAPLVLPLINSGLSRKITLVTAAVSQRITGVNSRVEVLERYDLLVRTIKASFIDLLIMGIYIALFIASILVFILDPGKRIFLYAGVVTLMMVLYTIFLSELIYYLVSDFRISLFFHGLSAIFLLPAILFFLYKIFENKYIRTIARFALLNGFFMIVLNGNDPTSLWATLFNSGAVVSIAISFAIGVYVMKKKEDKNSNLYLYSGIIFCIALLHDVLIYERVLEWTRLLIIPSTLPLFATFAFSQVGNFVSLQKEASEKERLFLQATLQGMKERMRPHFLLNTLEMLSSLVYKNPAKAVEGISHLSDNYSYFLRHSKAVLTPLVEEIDFVRSYIDLLLMRFSDTLSVSINIAGDISERMIPPMTLQTLVENSYKHGIRKIGSGEIIISIEAVKVEETLISIVNDGEIALKGDFFSGTLGNIRKRLEHYYQKSGIEINSEKAKTRVALYLGPLKNGHFEERMQ